MTDPEEINEYVAEPDTDQQPDEDTLIDRGVDDALDEGYSPPEKPSTPMRERYSPSDERDVDDLEERIYEEQPDEEIEPSTGDIGGEVGDERAGRLDSGSDLADSEGDDVTATDVGIDGGAAGAEEAAVHEIDPDDGEASGDEDAAR